MEITETGLMNFHEPKPLPEIGNRVAAFAHLVNAGVESWVKAGRVLVEIMDSYPDALAEIQKLLPGVSNDMIFAFERIGRKKIYPYLLIDNCPGAKRLLGLPYDSQVRFYKERLQLVTAIKEGAPVVELMKIQQLKQSDVDRVFGPDGVRSVEEQTRTFDASVKSILPSTAKDINIPPSSARRSPGKTSPAQGSRPVTVAIVRVRIDGKNVILEPANGERPTASIVISEPGTVIEIKMGRSAL